MSKEINDKMDEGLMHFYMEADKNIIEESLKENLKNPQAYEKVKKKIMFLISSKIKKEHNDKLLALAQKFRDAISSKIEKPVVLLKELIQQNPSFALYRNLDRLTNDDIVDIIKDKDLIQLLEKLDEDNKGN